MRALTVRCLRWLRSHPYTVFAAIFLAGSAIPYCVRRQSDWEVVYVVAAHRLRAGEALYQPTHGFVYPPINAWIALPFTELSRVQGRVLGYGVQVTWLLVCVVAAWRLSGGGRLEGEPSVGWREHAVFLF